MCHALVHGVEDIAHPALRVIKREAPDARRDIALINVGLHYRVGDPKYEEGFAFLKAFIRQHREELPQLLWKDTPPQHFESERGHSW